MADNFISYNRFTALPPNISEFGVTVEEVQLQKGAPDANPVLAPMASPRVSETRLALAPGGSDRLRLENPASPQVNPFEGPKSTLSLSRNAVKKLSSNVIADLGNVVATGANFDASMKSLMGDSLRRVNGMRDYMSHLNQMSEAVMVRTAAERRDA